MTTLAPLDHRGTRSPLGYRAPPAKTIWFPFHGYSGSPSAGQDISQGFLIQGDFCRQSVADLGFTTTPTGIWTSPNYATLPSVSDTSVVHDPADSQEHDFLDAVFEQIGMLNQQLLIGFEWNHPTGNVAALSTVLTWGNTTSGNSGFRLELAASERFQITHRGIGATASTSVQNIGGTGYALNSAATWYRAVMDLRGTGTGEVSATLHYATSGAVTSLSPTTVNYLLNSATSGPGANADGLTLWARRAGAGALSDFLQEGILFQNFWAQRRTAISTTLGAAACLDMVGKTGWLPRSLYL